MNDREKVIKTLECISNGAKQPCRDCEYSKREEWCIAECAKDALALLKAQEPRVMAGAELTDTELIEKIRKAPIVLKPNVDAVPVVHGRWIDENTDDSLDPRMRCSICTGVESPLLKWRYCPNCGAKMDGERRDDDDSAD